MDWHAAVHEVAGVGHNLALNKKQLVWFSCVHRSDKIGLWEDFSASLLILLFLRNKNLIPADLI